MKTPKEIKNGLECCPREVGFDSDCQNCPYKKEEWCSDKRNADALEYIQQLESNYSQVSKALCGKENAALEEILLAVSQVKAELAAVKRERDAAVRGLHGDCETCKHYETENCAYCVHDPDAWCAHEDNWEWEGVCPENTEVQK